MATKKRPAPKSGGMAGPMKGMPTMKGAGPMKGSAPKAGKAYGGPSRGGKR